MLLVAVVLPGCSMPLLPCWCWFPALAWAVLLAVVSVGACKGMSMACWHAFITLVTVSMGM